MSNSDNRINEDKPTSGSSPRLSIRIPRNITKFGEGDLMSPRTTTVSHPSSCLKEVPRAALFFSDSPPLTSEFESPTVALTEDLIGMTEDDPNLGLKALADASLPTERISSPPEEIIPELNEDEVLGKLFTSQFEEDLISQIYKDHCHEDKISEARGKLNDLIVKSDELLQSKSISMSLKNILPLYIQRIIEQETSRTGKTDFTNLLMDDFFISASATVILMLPRLISILFRIEDVTCSLKSNLFDVLLTIEQVMKAFPELMKLPETRKRISQMEQILLEDAVWKDKNNGSNTLYKLLESEFKSVQVANCPSAIMSTLSGIRASQRALETLSGFSGGSGCRLTRLELFFRKFLRLSAQRLQCATLRLGLSRPVIQLAWELFFDLIQREGSNPEHLLFQNRHLNQILMSTIYCASHLMEQERTFYQISQVLPRIQSNTSYKEPELEIYKFYNEIFIVPLRKKIESFLIRRHEEVNSGTVIDDSWILNGLFTTAPFPSNPQYQLSTNVTLNRLNQPKVKSKQTFTKYEWLNPTLNSTITPTSSSTHTHTSTNTNAYIRTPSRTSQLLNYSSESIHGHKRFITDDFIKDTNVDDNARLKKIARKLDFTNECEET